MRKVLAALVIGAIGLSAAAPADAQECRRLRIPGAGLGRLVRRSYGAAQPDDDHCEAGEGQQDHRQRPEHVAQISPGWPN